MQRALTLASLELRSAWRRPSVWMLIVILLFLNWGFSAGSVTIGAGSRVAGGERAFLNSEFNLAFMDMLVFALFWVFFVCTAFGNAPTEDDALRVIPIIGSTGLTPREYVVGRWLGVALTYLAIVVVNAILQMAFFEFYPVEEPERVRGAFAIANYLRPMLLFTVLPMLSLGAFAFALGALTRQAVVVFALPVALLLGSVFFLWDFAPSWLPSWADRSLQAVDIAGFRWLNETYLKVDRGVAFYNTQPLALDGLMIAQRSGLVVVGAAALMIAAQREQRRWRAPYAIAAARVGDVIAAAESARIPPAPPLEHRAIAALGMRQRAVGPGAAVAAAVTAFRAEARELRRSPGLWIFVPLIVLQCVGFVFRPGPFDTPSLVSAGTFAADSYNTVTLLSLFMVLYYFTESLARDDRVRIGAIVSACPAFTLSLVVGKMLACAMTVVLTVLGAVWASMAVATLVQAGETGILLPPSLLPFVLAWGALLSATLFAWMCFLALAWSLFRNRYASYLAGIGALVVTGWCVTRGWMNWVFNWHLWNGMIWTDFQLLPLDRTALLLNRALWILVGLVMLHAAVEWWRRRAPDAQGISSRLQWSVAWRRVARLMVFGVPAIVCATTLALMVRAGDGGGPELRRQRDYFVANERTWRDVPQPLITVAELELDVDPDAGSIAVAGTYVLTNRTDAPMRQFAITPNTTFTGLEFTFEGEAWTDESVAAARRLSPWAQRVANRSGLWVFTPREPLAPGASVELGFRHVAPGRTTPANPGGAGEFIIRSAVLLNSFGPSFLPMVGFVDGVGQDPQRTPEPKRPGPDDWKKVTKTAFGTGGETTMKAVVRVPAEFRANMPGVCTADTVAGGVRTMRWESDHPIMAVNLAAGRWEESRGKTTAIWHLPQHGFNVPVMLEALDGAHEWYSTWFWPYPWKELRISEFPALAGYAQGFPTNIVFSEGIGFMSKPTPEQDTPFMVTAHEAAHQWWGNILRPGDGPGGNILSEGMAHWSTARLIRQLRGERARMAFMRQIEFIYGNSRSADDELPMVEIDGSRNGDGTVTYDKGGWVFWMLMEHLGAERMDAGVRAFIEKFLQGPDFPLLQDFVEAMRPHAPDAAAYDAFAKQWFFDVVVPEFKVESAVTTAPTTEGGPWRTVLSVRNAGTGTVPLEVAVTNGEDRWPETSVTRTPEERAAAARQRPEYLDARSQRTIGPGETVELTIESAFRPEKAIIDPDVRTLMLNRKGAETTVRSTETTAAAAP
jgi:hypothetical protein